MKVVFGATRVGESDDVLVVGREYYFPTASVQVKYLHKNSEVLHCPNKGYATCYDIVSPEGVEHSGAWEYAHPYPESAHLKGRIGFARAFVVEG